jgi:hypothetical protein
MSDELKYPVGRFERPERFSVEERAAAIRILEAAPARVRDAVKGLSAAQLDTPYREGGWTVRQVVHHMADSHLNAYARVRLALVEDNPTVRAYDEGDWAALADAKAAPVESSLSLLAALHERWAYLLRSLDDEGFNRSFVHPEGWSGTARRFNCRTNDAKHNAAGSNAARCRWRRAK